ncbi:MAG: VIT1/CCC1 transporter family protein [Anaerolineaceae bacterium]
MSLTKRLDDAREAYKKKDLAASAEAHSPKVIIEGADEEHGGKGSQYIGNIVYGGLDGVVTTFAAVSGVAGAALGPNIILIMGMANLLADGFSMAVGSYLSDKSEQEYYNREEEREAWEVDHFPEGEKQELVTIYESQGYSPEDASNMTETIAKDKRRWVDAMMLLELGLIRDDKKPITGALATFAAFAIAGVIPLTVYLIGLATPIPGNLAFTISAVLSGVTLFGLGAAKVKVTGLNPLRSGLEMLLVGGTAAGVAYLVGMALKGLGA